MIRMSSWPRAGLASLVVSLAAASACTIADLPVAPLPAADAGADVAPMPPPDSGADAHADADAAAPRPPPVFLDPSAWSDLLALDAAFPFGVTRKVKASGPVLGARWGRHGGPAVTTGLYGGPLEVVRWTLPAQASGDASKAVLSVTSPGSIPASPFFGSDGMVDLPFGAFSILTYTAGGPPFTGEALLYGPSSYATLASRAFSNGIYSVVGVATQSGGRLFFTALSPLSASTSGTTSNGLYVADVCGGSLVPSGGCAPGFAIFSWNGFSGPVAVDAVGDVFAAGSLVGGQTSDAVFGLSATQALAGAPQAATTLAAVDTMGTSSLAAVAPEGAAPGWILGKGYDGATPASAYAQAFTGGATLAKAGALVTDAVTAGPAATGFSLFADDEGDPWIAVETSTEGWLLELRRKP
jgi:hypothetical protein